MSRMDNAELFRAIGSKTRVKMLKLLLRKNYHITGLAREIGISVPVAAKHVRILEDAGLVSAEEFGNTKVLRLNRERLYGVLDAFSEEYDVSIPKGTNILDILKRVSGVGIKKIGEKEFIVSINGEEGFYIYEVDGSAPNKPVNEFKMEKDGEVAIKRLVPVLKKRVRVHVKEVESGEVIEKGKKKVDEAEAEDAWDA